jgi:hypothetical protein
MDATDVRVIKAYRLFRDSMRKHGKHVAFPKQTNPKKTYSWRYISNFLDKYDEEGLTDENMRDVINAVVKEAKKKNCLRYGVSILGKIDILESYEKSLENNLLFESKLLDGIISSKSFVDSKGPDWYSSLSGRKNRWSFMNMTMWFDMGLISADFVSTSESCGSVLKIVSGHERGVLPSDNEIIKIRTKILMNDELRSKVQNVLGKEIVNNGLFSRK